MLAVFCWHLFSLRSPCVLREKSKGLAVKDTNTVMGKTFDPLWIWVITAVK